MLVLSGVVGKELGRVVSGQSGSEGGSEGSRQNAQPEPVQPELDSVLSTQP